MRQRAVIALLANHAIPFLIHKHNNMSQSRTKFICAATGNQLGTAFGVLLDYQPDKIPRTIIKVYPILSEFGVHDFEITERLNDVFYPSPGMVERTYKCLRVIK